MTEFYEAALDGKTSQLQPLEIQYADYAVWQRNWLQGEVLEQQVAYWRKRLDGAPPVLVIPPDRPRPEKPTFRGSMHRSLQLSLLDAVRALSRQQGSTSFMTLLAGFQTLILHYTRQPDIVLGTDLANRTTMQTEALIGFFVNLLALRTDFRAILLSSSCWRECVRWLWVRTHTRMCPSTSWWRSYSRSAASATIRWCRCCLFNKIRLVVRNRCLDLP